MEIGETIRHPILRVALQVGEATIREAWAATPELMIYVDLEPLPDGREGLRVTVRGGESRGRFVMLLRNYFDREALRRVACEAWRRRERFGNAKRDLQWGGCGLN